MPQASVTLTPGLNTEMTPSLNQAGYVTTNLGRFRNGLFEKLGGWSKFYNGSFAYPIQACFAWKDLSGNARLAVGTRYGTSVLTSGVYESIYPQTYTTTGAVNGTTKFTTTIGAPTVTVVDPGLTNVQYYDSVVFDTPVTVGGIILSGMYQVVANLSSTSYTITARTNATASVTNGGALPVLDSTSGSSVISVTLADHGLAVGSQVNFAVSTTVGGTTVSGVYPVLGVTSSSVFTIVAYNSATGTATVTMNSGNSHLVYYLATGPVAPSVGYGVGNYGDGQYGIGTSTSGATGSSIDTTNWSYSNWGEILIASPKDYPLFYWGPESGYSSRPIGAGPSKNTGAFVSTSTQILIAYGSTVDLRIGGFGIGQYQDPLLIQWSDQSNFLQWTPSATTQAGNFRLPSGTKIIGGLSTQNKDIIWTDADVWAMTYTGYPYTFNVTKVGSNCGLIANHACVSYAGGVYWMGPSSFFAMDSSGLRPIPCPVWDAVFQDLNTAYSSTCFCMSNTLFNEIWFFYPSISGGATTPDKYAKYNLIENVWDIGDLPRTCGIDQSSLGSPILGSSSGFVYQHEVSTDSDGSPLSPSFSTGYFNLSEAEDIVFIDRIIPDFRWGKYGGSTGANVTITVYGVYYPGDTERTYGPFTVNSTTEYINCRIRARLIRFKVESNDMGSFWRLGHVRFRFAPDGRR